MKKITLCLLSLHTLLAGALLISLQKGLIVFKPCASNIEETSPIQAVTSKKRVMLHFWQENRWKQEAIELIWHDSALKNAELIISNWLSLLEEEHLLEKKITLQSVVSTQSNTLYVSFDRYPCNNQGPIIAKIHFFEGLLKTLRENGIKMQNVCFLINHAILQDPHLDFSKPWPLKGFLT